MAKTTNGNCTNCGRKGVLSVLHGGKVCNTCRYLLAAANNNVPALAGAVRTVGKVEEMIKALIPDEGGKLAVEVTSGMLQEISSLVGYTGESPDELVAAVRKATSMGAHQLTSEAEAGALRTIAGIVGYEGTDGKMLVEAVRKRALTCASCDSEDALAELREIVGYYVPDQGDKGLVDAVRRMALRDASSNCADCTALRDDLDRSTRVIEELRAELTIAQQARDKWEQRAVQAEQNVEALEAELRNAESAPVPCANNTYLLDIALAVIREEHVPAGKIASLIEAARRAA